MNRTSAVSTVAELSILYEISLLRFSESEEGFAEEVIEKAARLFGMRRLALLAGEGKAQRLIASLAFRNEKDISKLIGQNKPNQFKFDFGSDGKLGALFMEQAHPIENRERRIYTFFARQVENALVAAREAAERKRWEEELQATEEELHVANEELKAANEELKEAQEQLIRSERLAAIGQLAGGVGHELRNPLGAIKNAVYYIKGKVAKSELAQKEPRLIEFLEIVDEEINSSNKIINDLLGFSRVVKPVVSPTQIKQVIDDALSRVPIPENIELTKRLDTDLNEIEVDPDQIQKVLLNIIMNAVQAMPEGGKLTVSTKEEGKFLEVEITDTGGGIPEETLDKIFEPLFTTRAKGIGLGLAVSKSIVDRHGGHIEVKSEVGEGTTFNVKLPLEAV